ncbi:ATP-binding cassette sub- A member 1 [Rhizophlyctis rosea]|uniref:ATP-binding cassette sub- A member 1 n=1 Tax=Rhizophlyctis rosea TaxID=64517 RepID=A0AAD5X4M9_9FUNG|nr:ATP-binding cassette sub- A member 1 [Rhizophlyctis rosea]
MYTPSTDRFTTIMRTFAEKNAGRTGQPAFQLESALSDVNQRPTTKLGIVPVPNSAFIYDYTLANPNSSYWAVTFSEETTPVPSIAYQIWYNASNVANNSDIYGRELVSFMRGMDEAIISVFNDPSVQIKADIDITLKTWPVIPPETLTDTIIKNLGPVFFFCSEMVIFINVLNMIVSEKELKLRHGMEMMGLKPAVYWISHFLTISLLVAIAALVTGIFGLIFQFTAFKETNFGVIFFTFFLFGEGMIMLAFFVTTFVRKARVAILVGIFFFIIGLLFESFVFSSSFLGYIWWDKGTSPAARKILILFPFFNFGKVFLDIVTYTTGTLDNLTNTYIPGPGFKWGSLYEPLPNDLRPTYGDDGAVPDIPPPVQSFYFLLMNMAIFAALTWYFDNVIPNEFGYKKPIWFFLTPEYWGIEFGNRKGVREEEWLAKLLKKRADIPDDEDVDVKDERTRASDPRLRPAVRIVNLRKMYGKKKVAVKSLAMSFEEGKLLALLGQNGAGKSTTMNILSGLTPATSGDALIYNLSVANQMHRIRAIMGVCPQHDILFDDLTATEHIQLYAGLKGVIPSEVPALIEHRLKAVRLWKVAGQRAGTYSGGMKRRLSLVISTIGDPKIIFMDEPTTGMDPVNRRHVWEFVEKFKKGRVIVLTTHSMEEADVLGDRIAIMAHGRLRAIGNSITLKNKYGAGYRISIVTDPARVAETKAVVASRVAGAVLEDDSAGALIYQFPGSSTTAIPDFVKYLDNDPDDLIRAWGISQTTLEEVFLKLIRDANPEGYGSYKGAAAQIREDVDPATELEAVRRRSIRRSLTSVSSGKSRRSTREHQD